GEFEVVDNMFTQLATLSRLVLRTAFSLVLTALLLGRYAPPGRHASRTDIRSAARPRYLAVASDFFPDPPYVPPILDVNASALAVCSLPGANDLELLGCSPWRDAAGQYHMVALSGGAVPDRPLLGSFPVELVRYTFPAGGVLGRAAIEPLPKGLI